MPDKNTDTGSLKKTKTIREKKRRLKKLTHQRNQGAPSRRLYINERPKFHFQLNHINSKAPKRRDSQDFDELLYCEFRSTATVNVDFGAHISHDVVLGFFSDVETEEVASLSLRSLIFVVVK